MSPDWQMHAPSDEPALAAALETVYGELYQQLFADEPGVNPALPIGVHRQRRIEGWRLCLLLTPWMLARIYLPETPPPIPLPDGWSAEEREGAEPVVVGPQITLHLGGQEQRLHLNHHPLLGHYLLQPLIQGMGAYPDADSVFAAWSDVIRHRDEQMSLLQKDCPWQREVSRREFFAGLRRRTATSPGEG